MAVRTAYAPVAASVLTATNLAKLPGGWIGYVEVTSNQGTITTAVDITSLTLSVTVGTGRRIRVSYQGLMATTVAGDTALITINEGATVLQQAIAPMTSSQPVSLSCAVVLTPSSGAHTYKIQGSRAAGTGTLQHTAGATSPAFICVEDIGATP